MALELDFHRIEEVLEVIHKNLPEVLVGLHTNLQGVPVVNRKSLH